MCLTLNADDLNVVHWWVDAAYGVHDDLKGHTGATMPIGKVSFTRISSKQKINITSSPQSDIVGVCDCSPQVMWKKYFL